jgi:hypothetical protein
MRRKTKKEEEKEEYKENFRPGTVSGSHLFPATVRRQRLGGLRFEASVGKKLARSHLNQ